MIDSVVKDIRELRDKVWSKAIKLAKGNVNMAVEIYIKLLKEGDY